MLGYLRYGSVRVTLSFACLLFAVTLLSTLLSTFTRRPISQPPVTDEFLATWKRRVVLIGEFDGVSVLDSHTGRTEWNTSISSNTTKLTVLKKSNIGTRFQHHFVAGDIHHITHTPHSLVSETTQILLIGNFTSINDHPIAHTALLNPITGDVTALPLPEHWTTLNSICVDSTGGIVASGVSERWYPMWSGGRVVVSNVALWRDRWVMLPLWGNVTNVTTLKGGGNVVVQGTIGEKTVFGTPLMDGEVIRASGVNVGIRSVMCRNGSVALSKEETRIGFWDEMVIEGVEIVNRHVAWFRVETLKGDPYTLASVTSNGTIRNCSDWCRLLESEEPQRFVVLRPKPTRGLKIILHPTPGLATTTTTTLADLLVYPQETLVYSNSYACSLFNTTSHAVLQGSYTEFHLALPIGEVEIALRKPPNRTHVEVSLPSDPGRFARVEFSEEWMEVYRQTTSTEVGSERVVVRIQPVDGTDVGVDAVRVRHVLPTSKKSFWMDVNGHDRERMGDVWDIRALNVSSDTTVTSSRSIPLGISASETHTTLLRLSTPTTPEQLILTIQGTITSTIIHNSTCILAGRFTHSVHLSSMVFTYHNIAFYDLVLNTYIPPPHVSQLDGSVTQFGVDGEVSNMVLSSDMMRIVGGFEHTVSQSVGKAPGYAVYDFRVGWVPGEFAMGVKRAYGISSQQDGRDEEWVVMSGSVDMQVEAVRVSGVASVDMMGPLLSDETVTYDSDTASRADVVPGLLPSSRVTDGVWIPPTASSGSQTLYVAGRLYLPLFGSRYGLARWQPGTAGWEGLDLDMDVEIDRLVVNDGNGPTGDERVWMVGRFPSNSDDVGSQVGLAYYTVSTRTVTRVGGALIPDTPEQIQPKVTCLTSSHSLIILSGQFTTTTHIPCSTLCAWDILTSRWTSGLPNLHLTGKVNAIMSYEEYVVVGGRFIVDGKKMVAGLYDWTTKKMISIPIPQNSENGEEVVAVSVQGNTPGITLVARTNTNYVLWETQIHETKHQKGGVTTVGVTLTGMYTLPLPHLTSITITPLPFPSTYALTFTASNTKSTVMLFTPSHGLRPLIHTSSHTGTTHFQILSPPVIHDPLDVMGDTRSGVPGWGTAVLVLLCVLTTALLCGVCVGPYVYFRAWKVRVRGEEGRKLMDEEQGGPSDEEIGIEQQQQQQQQEGGDLEEAVMGTPAVPFTTPTPNFFEGEMMRMVSTPRLRDKLRFPASHTQNNNTNEHTHTLFPIRTTHTHHHNRLSLPTTYPLRISCGPHTPHTPHTSQTQFSKSSKSSLSSAAGTLYIATHPNPGTEFGEIAFERGDTILVLSREDDEWWMGMVDYGTGQWGDIGVFPRRYVSLPVFYANRDIAGRPM